MSTEKSVRIRAKIDNSVNWKNKNPTLLKNELAYDSTNNIIKYGTEDNQTFDEASVLYSPSENQLTWGNGQHETPFYRIEESVGPVSTTLITELGTRINAFAFLPGEYIDIEGSIDGGKTWFDKGFTNEQKTHMLTRPSLSEVGGTPTACIGDFTSYQWGSDAPNNRYSTTDDMLRITISCYNEEISSSMQIYGVPVKFGLCVNGTNKEDKSWVKLEYCSFVDPDAWIPISDKIYIQGWPQWNVLNTGVNDYSFPCFGCDTSKVTTSTNAKKIRFIIGRDINAANISADATYTRATEIINIVSYMHSMWNTPNKSGMYGTPLFDWSTSKKVQFKGPVYVPASINDSTIQKQVHPISLAPGQSTNSIVYTDDTNTASADISFAWGSYQNLTNSRTMGVGYGNNISGANAFATGDNNNVGGMSATAFGSSTTASGFASTAIGVNTTAVDSASFASGTGITAFGHSETALGKYNTPSNNSDYALIIGNGTNQDNTSNALSLKWNGHMQLTDANKNIMISSNEPYGDEIYFYNQGEQVSNSIIIGNDTKLRTNYSSLSDTISIGNNNYTSESEQILIGNNIYCAAENNGSIIIGNKAQTFGDVGFHSIVIGQEASAAYNGGIAIGCNACADSLSVAIGYNTKSYGNEGITIGSGNSFENATDASKAQIIIGQDNTLMDESYGYNNIIVGSENITLDHGSIIYGINNFSYGDIPDKNARANIVIGKNNKLYNQSNIIFGEDNYSDQKENIIFGCQNKAYSSDTLIIGKNNMADLFHNIAIGTDITNLGYNSIIIGHGYASGSDSILLSTNRAVTTYSSNIFQVNEYPVMDLSTGKIYNDRLSTPIRVFIDQLGDDWVQIASLKQYIDNYDSISLKILFNSTHHIVMDTVLSLEQTNTLVTRNVAINNATETYQVNIVINSNFDCLIRNYNNNFVSLSGTDLMIEIKPFKKTIISGSYTFPEDITVTADTTRTNLLYEGTIITNNLYNYVYEYGYFKVPGTYTIDAYNETYETLAANDIVEIDSINQYIYLQSKLEHGFGVSHSYPSTINVKIYGTINYDIPGFRIFSSSTPQCPLCLSSSSTSPENNSNYTRFATTTFLQGLY